MKFKNVCTALVALITMLAVATGCERKPEDLETWRDAQGGFEKIAQWTASADEPMPVRERGIQILIEEGQVNELLPLMEKVGDEDTQARLAAAALPTVQGMWDAQDQPSVDDAQESGQVAVGQSKTVDAKDAAFYLQPFARAETKTAYETILASWIAEEQDLRTQLGRTTVGQVLPRAGEAGVESMMSWLKETAKPATVQRQVLEHTKDEGLMNNMAEVLVARAREADYDVSGELEVAILENEGSKIVGFLKESIKREGVADRTKDAFMDAIVRIEGDRATSYFADLVGSQKGLMRWVSLQRLIEIRGKAGILAAQNALPLDPSDYDGEDLEKENEITCNFISTEMAEQGVDDVSTELKRGLQSPRWPAKVMSLKCVQVMGVDSLKADVESLTASRDKVPGWGEAGETTLGAIAKETLEKI